MGRIDRAYVYNTGLRDHTKPRIVFYKGERRRMLWPAGTVERFVNLQGTVVQSVLVPPGMPASKEGLAQARAKLYAHKTTDGEVVGFIEHARCPLKTGVADRDPILGDEMERCRSVVGPACKEHPVTFKKTPKGIEYFDSCPHIQWVIEERRKLHRARVEARSNKQKSMQQIEQEKLDAAQQQAADTRALLEKLSDRMEAQPTRQRKQAPEPNE
jgi:hypothetical protein